MKVVKCSDDWFNGQIDSYCYMVSRGKPAALMPVQKRNISSLKSMIVNTYNLKTYEQPLDKQWVSLWIYKKDFMLEIIKCLPEKPKTIFDHWVLGKAFGFSDEAIEEFIKN